MQGGNSVTIPDASLDHVDWEQVYLDLLAYKESKGYVNLAILPVAARRIMAFRKPRLYSLTASESVIKPKSFGDAIRLRGTVVSILSKYMDRFYRVKREAWDSAHMVYKPLDQHDANFHDYMVKVPRSKTDLIEAIRKLIEQAAAVYKQDMQDLPSIHFDRHLYQPLLIEGRDGVVKSVPPNLTNSESRFVKDLRAWCRKEKDEGRLPGRQGYLPVAKPQPGERRRHFRDPRLLSRLHPLDQKRRRPAHCIRRTARHVPCRAVQTG